MFNNYNLIDNDDFLGSNVQTKEFDYNSFYRAYVESIEDPDHLGRIKVRIPSLHLNNSTSSLPYAYPATMVGLGNQVGQFILPPVGSIVFVTFEYSNEHRIIYFGGIPTTHEDGKRDQYYGRRVNNGEPKKVTEDDIPTEYKGTQYIIYKSPMGSLIMIDDNDFGPSLVLKDSLGQEISMYSNNIDDEVNEGYIVLKHDDDNLIRIEKDDVIVRTRGVDYHVPWASGGSTKITTTISDRSTNEEVPGAKAVYDYVEDKVDTLINEISSALSKI